MPPNKTAINATLVAALLASVGGYAFLHKHPNPTLRDVYAGCEKGDINGIVCCEDVLKLDASHALELAQASTPLTDNDAKLCGAIRPGQHDPLNVREKEQDDFDKAAK